MPDQTDDGPLTPTQVRWLKIAVVVMGIMIVVGIAILIGRILYLASSGPRQAASIIRAAGPAADGTIALPPGASVRTMTMSGDRLAIHYEGPRGTGIVVIDISNGARLGRFDVVPEPPR